MADTKKMIHDAYGMHHLQREGNGGDPVSGRLHGMAKCVMEAGKIIAAVENQETPLPDVLIVCYAPDTVPTRENFRRIQEALVKHILATHEVRQHRTLLKLRALAEVAVIAFRMQARGFGEMPDSMVYTMAGLQKQNWHDGNRPWRRCWRDMGRQMQSWHRKALVRPNHACEALGGERSRWEAA